MLGKLLLPGVITLGFFLFTHQPDHPHTASAYVSQACGATAGVSASFAWPLPVAGAEQTWLDLGVDPAFALGWYQGHGPLPSTQNTLAVTGLTGAVTYYYRVNALTGGTWKSVAKGSFVAACVLPVAAPSTADAPVVPPPTEVPAEAPVAEATDVAADAPVAAEPQDG